MEELLKIAKNKYPVGTKFIPAHMLDNDYNKSNYLVIHKDGEFVIDEGEKSIYQYINGQAWVTQEHYSEIVGNISWNRVLYIDGKWAEIISTPEIEKTKKDNINPSHYQNGKVECIDALESATVNKTGIEAICVANTVKYLWRYEDKNGLEDVKKAQWYLEKLIKHLENVK